MLVPRNSSNLSATSNRLSISFPISFLKALTSPVLIGMFTKLIIAGAVGTYLKGKRLGFSSSSSLSSLFTFLILHRVWWTGGELVPPMERVCFSSVFGGGGGWECFCGSWGAEACSCESEACGGGTGTRGAWACESPTLWVHRPGRAWTGADELDREAGGYPKVPILCPKLQHPCGFLLGITPS